MVITAVFVLRLVSATIGPAALACRLPSECMKRRQITAVSGAIGAASLGVILIGAIWLRSSQTSTDPESVASTRLNRVRAGVCRIEGSPVTLIEFGECSPDPRLFEVFRAFSRVRTLYL